MSADSQDRENLRRVAWSNIPDGYHWLLMLLTFPMPYILYTSAIYGQAASISGWLLPFLALGLTTLLCVGLHRRIGSLSTLYLTFITCTVLIEGVWWLYPDHHADLWAYPFLVLAVIYRMIRLENTPSISAENRSSFVFEAIATAIAVLFIILVQPNGAMRQWLVFLMLLTLCLRLYAMWQVERIQTNSQPAKGNFALIVALAIAALWLGPKIIYWLIFAVIGGGAVLGAPFVYLLNAILPKNLFSSLSRKMPIMNMANSMQQREQQVTHTHSFVFIWYIVYAVAAIVLIVLVWRFAKRARGEPEKGLAESTMITDRRHVTRTESVRYLPTHDPVRLQYQHLLEGLRKAGKSILPFETARQYKQRLEKLDTQDGSATVSDSLSQKRRWGRSLDRVQRVESNNVEGKGTGAMPTVNELTPDYERARYGPQQKDEDRTPDKF